MRTISTVKLLVGPFGFSHPGDVLDQQLHRLNECQALNRPVVFTTPGKRVALRVARIFKSHAVGEDSCNWKRWWDKCTSERDEERTQVHDVRLSGSLQCEDEIEIDSGETVTQNPAL